MVAVVTAIDRATYTQGTRSCRAQITVSRDFLLVFKNLSTYKSQEEVVQQDLSDIGLVWRTTSLGLRPPRHFPSPSRVYVESNHPGMSKPIKLFSSKWSSCEMFSRPHVVPRTLPDPQYWLGTRSITPLGAGNNPTSR